MPKRFYRVESRSSPGRIPAEQNADIDTGGASYLFTRIKKADSSTSGFYFKIGRLSRQDAISYESDKFGRISALRTRGTDINTYKKFAKGRSNETLFKEGFSLDDLDFIRVHDTKERDEVIAVFKAHGITALPDGRPIEDIVVAGHKRCRNRRLI